MKFYILSILLFTVNACHNVKVVNINLPSPDTSHKIADRKLWSADDSNYVALKDSAKLVHIKNQFYRNKNGVLFDKMDAPKNPIDIDAGVVTFFERTDQNIDPITFEIIDDSWYARDKNHIYYYKPSDSGMSCETMEKANVKYFKLLGNSGDIGADNRHVFNNGNLMEHLDPLKMRIITDKDGTLKKIISGSYIYDNASGIDSAVLIAPKNKGN